MPKAHNGFTLVEVLVLLLIVATLALMLFPLFARARTTARENACINNLSQLAAAILMYAADYDGCAPGAGHPLAQYSGSVNERNDFVSWQFAVEPYFSSRSLLSCPAAPDWCVVGRGQNFPGQPCAYGVPFPASWNGVSIGYAMNTLLQLSVNVNDDSCSWFNWGGLASGQIGPAAGWGGANLKRLTNPGRVLLVADSNSTIDACGNKINWPRICGNEGPGCRFIEVGIPENARHDGGNNWAYADGHVRWVYSGIYRCIYKGNEASDRAILTTASMQKVHGVDQLN